tara:strand:- start:39 stop:839 length:801 start_codon:yes stop_codon:yes gene_type:complete
MPEDPEVTFHPLSADKNPRFSSQVYSGEEPGSSGFGLTWEEGGKQQSDVFRSGDPLPGNISWKAPEDRYASPLPGGIGEVISVGPEYATFEFNVPVSDRYPEGRMRTRMNLGRTRGDYAQRMEALRREAQEGKDSQYGYEGASPEQIIALKKLMGSLSIMTPDLLRTSRQASLLERADRLSRQGDALGYASEKGPYAGQDLSDDDIFEASKRDLEDASSYGEYSTQESDGIESITYDTPDGLRTFAILPGGAVNVTGHLSYGPEKG